jgi:hypothetical protein
MDIQVSASGVAQLLTEGAFRVVIVMRPDARHRVQATGHRLRSLPISLDQLV